MSFYLCCLVNTILYLLQSAWVMSSVGSSSFIYSHSTLSLSSFFMLLEMIFDIIPNVHLRRWEDISSSEHLDGPLIRRHWCCYCKFESLFLSSVWQVTWRPWRIGWEWRFPTWAPNRPTCGRPESALTRSVASCVCVCGILELNVEYNNDESSFLIDTFRPNLSTFFIE